jgi:hypothetical protein
MSPCARQHASLASRRESGGQEGSWQRVGEGGSEIGRVRVTSEPASARHARVWGRLNPGEPRLFTLHVWGEHRRSQASHSHYHETRFTPANHRRLLLVAIAQGV